MKSSATKHTASSLGIKCINPSEEGSETVKATFIIKGSYDDASILGNTCKLLNDQARHSYFRVGSERNSIVVCYMEAEVRLCEIEAALKDKGFEVIR